MSEICFVEIRPRILATGAETIVRLAGGGTDTPYVRDGHHYRAGIVQMPRFRAEFAFDDNGWSGGTIPTSGALNFMPGAPGLVAELSQYYWREAPIIVDAGDENGQISRRLTGTVANMAANEGQLSFALVDPSRALDKALLGSGFAGTGGIEGPSEATGRAKRRSWGVVFNVEGELLDKVNNIYEFGDPAHPIFGFDALRDKGRAGPINILSWQGSIAATFAALQAASAPEGGGVVAPSIACAKWWTVPAGPLTADIRGETAAGYIDTAVGIAARLLAAASGPAIVDFAAAQALRPAACGVHIASSSDTVAQALDRLLLGVSLFWVLQPDGSIRIGEWAWGTPSAALPAIFVGRDRQLPPIKSRTVGYRRNHRQHQASEISAAILLADDVSYLDGTPIEALKPAEPGANVTGNHTAAAIANQGTLATQNNANWNSQVSSRPTELTDGRIPAAVRAGGGLQGDLWGGAALIPISEVLEYGMVGKSLSLDPDFSRGTLPSNYGIYNNSGGSNVTAQVVADPTAPNGSGYVLRVSYNGGGVVEPGWGGVLQMLSGPGSGLSRPAFYARGTKIAYIIRAKIPVGRSIAEASNATGDGGSFQWLTPQAGTGAWATYIGVRTIGTTGSFSTTGHIYTWGGSNAAFDWDIALYDQRELGSADMPQLARLVTAAGGITSDASLITSEGTAAAIANQGILATRNDAVWGSHISGVPARLNPNPVYGENYLDWNRVVYDNGSGLIQLRPAELGANVTANHTAAAIANQGAFATVNTAGYGSGLLTGFGTLAPRNTVLAGVHLRNAADTVWLGDGDIITASGTAAAISNQGVLATRNDAAWGSHISARPTELTDGRISGGLRADGTLQSGLWGGAHYVPVSEVLEYGLVGKSLSADPDFSRGVASSQVAVYNNSGGNNVTFTLETDATAPNGSGRVLRVSYNGGGVVAPGYGGIVQFLTGPGTGISRPGFYARGTEIAYIIRAKIPVGRTIEEASNATGAGGTFTWLTGRAGTGDWATYIGIRTIGTTGTFDPTGYIYVSGGADIAFTWDIALYDQRELGSAELPQLARLVTAAGAITTDASLITSEGTAAAIANQGALATQSSLAAGSGFLTGFGSLSTRNNIRLGETDSSWAGLIDQTNSYFVTNNLAITSLGTAAAIAGQGSGATANTLSQLDSAAGTKLSGVETGATRDVSADTRDDDYAPQHYRVGWNGRWRREFKGIATVGSPAGAQGTYGLLDTYTPWADHSGGPVSQYLTDSAGASFVRYSSGISPNETWAAWQPEYSGNRKPRFGEDLLEVSGGAVATLPNFKTSQGTAAAIANQGAFATINTAGYGSGLLTGFGTLAPRNTVLAGSHLRNSADTVFLGDADIITASGTASAIANQSAWATTSLFTPAFIGDKTSRLDNSGYLQAHNVYVNNVAFLSDRWPAEANANVTETRTAAAISNQGSLATLSSAPWSTHISGKPPVISNEAVTADEFLRDPSVWGISSSFFQDGGGDGWWIRSGTSDQPSPIGTFANATIIDPNATYEAYWDFLEEGTGSPNARFYTVICAWDINGNYIAGDGSFWFYPSAFALLQTRGEWHQYSARFGKNTARPFPANAVRFSVGVLMNYGGGGNAFRARRMWAQRVSRDWMTSSAPSAWSFADDRAVRLHGADDWGVSVAFGKSELKGPQSLYGEPTHDVTFMGLTDSANPSSFADFDASLFVGWGDGNVHVYENGTPIQTFSGYTNISDLRLEIVYDGVSFLYYINGVLARTSNAGVNRGFRAAVESYYDRGRGFGKLNHQPGRSAAVIGNNTFNTSGTLLASGALVTSEGTAAAIANQGSLATRNDAAWGTHISGVPSRLDANPTYGENYLNHNRVVYDNGAGLSQLRPAEAGANVTETRTAAAIANQGTGATASTLAQLDSTANTKLSGIEAGADVTANSVPRHEPPAVTRQVTASHTGAIDPSSQLPLTGIVNRMRGATDVSGSSTWSIQNVAGITGGTVTVSNGNWSVPTGVTLAAQASFVVRSVRDGVTLEAVVAITRKDASAPAPSGGGTSIERNSFGTVTSTSEADLFAVATVKTGSGGQLAFAAPLTTSVTNASPTGTFGVDIRWRYRTVGGSWNWATNDWVTNDYAAFVSEESGFYYGEDGFVSSAPTVTGLSASTDYEVQLVGRQTSGSPSKTVSFSGTAVVTGS